MSKTKRIVWELEPHTEAKHLILRNYLRAWFPIMGSSNDHLLFIDGYSGPGQYKNGEDGSPIIAIKEALNYYENCKKHNWKKPQISFIFIEQDKEICTHLLNKIKSISLPKEIRIKIVNSNFLKVIEDMVNYFEENKAILAPAFIFIDPFGYDLRFELVAKLMNNPKCEVFINFMYEFINRFITRDKQQAIMGRLFGSEEWKNLKLEDKEPSERKEAIHELYKYQLETHAAKYVRSFEMKGKKNSTKYFLFYATNHKRGLERMKDAMWKVDAGGNYTFGDRTNPSQGVLFGLEPDFNLLKRIILDKYLGKIVKIDEVEDFVLCETPFRKAHIKNPILAPMERNNEIAIHTERKKKCSYPSNTLIEFISEHKFV